MKDPMVVAFNIPRPWPRRQAGRFGARRDRRWDFGRMSDAPWWTARGWSPFWQLAGRRYYWPHLITVWHVDPSGYDTDERCAISFQRDAQGRIVRDDDGEAKLAWAWRFHVHHWKVQVPPLQELRRRLLTRCSWCGGRHRKSAAVNVSAQWDRERNPWWRGETGLYHSACQMAESSSRACTCDDPITSRDDGTGTCARCGLHRSWRTESYVLENQREYKTLAKGERPSPELIARTRARAEQGRVS